MKSVSRIKKVSWVFAILILLGQSVVFADAPSDISSALDNMKQEMLAMQKTLEQQNLRIQQLESKKVLESAQPSVPMQSSAAQSLTENDWQKGIKDNIGEAIPWLKGAKFAGDFRLRYEYFDFYDFHPDAGTAQDRSRNRFRIRLRWGFEKDYGDDWKVGFRLATGSTTDQTSTNQTLGNPGYFNFKSFNIEKAFVSYTPNGLKDYGAVKGVKIAAGKTDNPFLRYSTPIVWDGDVTPEGLYEQATVQLLNTEETKVNIYATAGQFILNENTGTDSDAQVYGYQAALNTSTYKWGDGNMPVDLTAALSWYQYNNWFQTVNNNSAATNYLRTNSLMADDFGILDFYPEVQFYVKDKPVTLWVNLVKNMDNVGSDDPRALGNDIHDADGAWGAGFKVGKIKNKGDIEGFYGYYEIGANAVVAAFSDSDFGGPGAAGYTNRKGHKFGLSYGLTKDATLAWTGYVVEPLNPFNGNAITGLQNSTNENVFRSQIDLVFKF